MSVNTDEDVFLKIEGFTFLDFNPVTGISTYFRTNEDGSTTLYSRADVSELLDVNKALFFDRHNEKLKDWVPLARMDDITMQTTNVDRAIKEGDRKYVKKVLNDSDLSKFRTSNLKV